jgi:uracil-DNA glycosylase
LSPTTASLLADVRRCTICAAHLPFPPRPILQVHPAAVILVAGQAPGRKAHQLGIPFADASGDRLRDWLGLSAEVFYDPMRVAIVPMGFCFPGQGKSGDRPPRPECAPTWRAQILSQLPNLKLILILGAYAQRYHLPGIHRSVTCAVEHWRDYWPALVPLPHPSPRNSGWLGRHAWFEADVVPQLRSRIAAVLGGAS